MKRPGQHENDKPKRLAEGLSKAQAHARRERVGKNPARTQPRGDARRKVANPRNFSPLARLVQSLGKEGIRFQMVGMSAALLQGVPASTTDTDIWVDLPERQYIRLLNLVVKQGGAPMAKTMYALADGSLVNFIFSMTGLEFFSVEYEQARELSWNGLKIRVLPLERIYESKRATAREKDIAHLPLLRRVMQGQRLASASGKAGGSRRKPGR
jgi:hypothetical protein